MTTETTPKSDAMTPLGTLLGVSGESALGVRSLQVDSRRVETGDLFVALPGASSDGRAFIEEAVAQGATAVLSTPDARGKTGGVTFIADPEPRRRYAEMAAAFHVQQPETRVAVTGTNGKTSVADFTRQIWACAGLQGASYGTLGLRSEKLTVAGGLTTPDPMALYSVLAQAARAGVTHLALEASSHGLDQYRLDGTRFQAAGFTNLTRDHLDYHGTFEAYFSAKARLFADLVAKDGGAAVMTTHDMGARMADLVTGLKLDCLSIGGSGSAIEIVGHHLSPQGQGLDIRFGGKVYSILVPLLGAFQGENALVALGLAHLAGLDFDFGLEALEKLEGVPGRMEFCGRSAAGGAVYIDYAHTPAGLETALSAAREHGPKALSVVFGCGGDRDTGKRPEMGRIAATHADRVYVTDDNPRSEKAAVIRSAILAASPGATEIGDRLKAIETAVSDLGAGDMLIIAGKGHEEGQTVGDQVLPFSDLKAVKSVLNGGSAS